MKNLMSLSIVPNHKVSKQPYNIPYHNPHFPLVKYNKIITDYFFWKQVQVAEEMAKMNGFLLVPSICLSWKRVKKFSAYMVPIGRKTFYQIKPADLTEGEKKKFLDYVSMLDQEVYMGKAN